MEALTSHTHWVLRAPAAFLHQQLLFSSLSLMKRYLAPFSTPLSFSSFSPLVSTPLPRSFQSVIESMPLRGSLSLSLSRVKSPTHKKSWLCHTKTDFVLGKQKWWILYSDPRPRLLPSAMGGGNGTLLLLAAYTWLSLMSAYGRGCWQECFGKNRYFLVHWAHLYASRHKV